VDAIFPGMLTQRGYELRLPADWPPAEVKVNGVAVPHAGPTGPGGKTVGWSFEGNTLTTIVPVPSSSVAQKVTVEVRRADGLTARRNELDGFAGAMTRLRGAYEAMQHTPPIAEPTEDLVLAMQTGDRIGYHPENAVEEIAHFHESMTKAQASVTAVGATFNQRVDGFIQRMKAESWRAIGVDAQVEKQRRLDAMSRAEKMVGEAGR